MPQVNNLICFLHFFFFFFACFRHWKHQIGILCSQRYHHAERFKRIRDGINHKPIHFVKFSGEKYYVDRILEVIFRWEIHLLYWYLKILTGNSCPLQPNVGLLQNKVRQGPMYKWAEHSLKFHFWNYKERGRGAWLQLQTGLYGGGLYPHQDLSNEGSKIILSSLELGFWAA